MSNPQIDTRAIGSSNEVLKKKILRDTRSSARKLYDNLCAPSSFIYVLILAAMPFVFPAFTLLCLFLSVIIYLLRINTADKEHLPYRMPKIEGLKGILDKGDPLPGRESFAKAEGIFYLGQEQNTYKQLWLKAKDILTHSLVFGTTGSGKTEFLVSINFNALALGSGFLYVDPKGSPKLAFQIYVMARILGRDDDFRVMNFNPGNIAVGAITPKRMSNTQNPFAKASGSEIEQIIVSLIPKAEGPNAIFAQNAKVLVSGIITALADLRDKELEIMSANQLNKYLNIDDAIALYKRKELSENAKYQLHTALRNFGWKEDMSEKEIKDSQSLNTQFGYARSYFGEVLTQLGFTYGYIYNNNLGEVDMQDVILQRRICVVILPALGKSPQELESLGKLILSSVRNATSVGLGNKLEGTAEDVLDSLPTNSKYPFLLTVDEYAAIPTQGFAEILTQGRSLGISAVVASQDWGGIEEGDKKGAGQILANTKIKYCLKLEDARGTWEVFKAQAGETDVEVSEGYEFKNGKYIDRPNVSIKTESRINLQDLQAQTEGEFHSFLNGEIVRGIVFYADPPIKKDTQLQLAHMLPIEAPNVESIIIKATNLKEIAQKIRQVFDTGVEFKIDALKSARLLQLVGSFDHTKQKMERLVTAFVLLLKTKHEESYPEEEYYDIVNNEFDLEEVQAIEESLDADHELVEEKMMTLSEALEEALDYPPQPVPQRIEDKDLEEEMLKMFKKSK